jgi:hypothetical protein
MKSFAIEYFVINYMVWKINIYLVSYLFIILKDYFDLIALSMQIYVIESYTSTFLNMKKNISFI